MKRRRSAAALLAALGAFVSLAAARFPQTTSPRGPATREESLERFGLSVPMRDGVRLAADLYLPAPGGRWPTVLVRTPYSRKTRLVRTYRFFNSRGYAVLIQDVRGRWDSQGAFRTIQGEAPDGYDTLNWIAEQPWSNTRVVMAGGSYLGMAQWWAALSENPHLAAIAPLFSGDDEYTDRYYSAGGALQLGHRLVWLNQNLTPRAALRPLFSSYIGHLPLRTADLAATTTGLPVWQTALDHPSYDAYWRGHSIREQASRLHTPALSMGGWFDNYVESDLDLFTRLAKAHQPVETWIGPWAHNPGLRFPTLDFGPNAALPIRTMQADWFDRWLGKPDTRESAERLPLLHIFVMGPDIWREEHEWPPARLRYVPFYLASGGHANTLDGDGALTRRPVRKAPPDTYTYDPKNPVPTAGGAICCDPVLLPPGPLVQNAVEQRTDVVVYTSAPLGEALEVTGPVKALLFVSTSMNDTDFTAKLVDVEAGGRALAVCDGLQRLRYRLSLDKPVFVKRNTAYEITVDAGVTSYVFATGHRIRLEISSSNFPRFDRNLNTSAPNADVTKLSKAKQTILHEKSYPSALILPIVPRRGN